MEIIADLHLHSKYSRACSKDLDIEHMEKYSKVKGIDLLGTGDFQHPKWQQELKNKLTEDGSGILRTKNNFPFLLTTEISLIYTQGGKGRKVHNVVWAKTLEIAAQVSDALKRYGRIDYDGRPIFGMGCPEFVDAMKGVDESLEVIPAHIWTPWFGVLGSKGGFDSIQEAFQDRTDKINAVETGLSSDPMMNWRLSSLDRFTLLSNSDSHSYWPWRLGREANVFELDELTYDNIIKAIKTKQGMMGTIEVDPGYGKYHYDGHRSCGVSLSPQESRKHNNLCPRCGRPLVIGVENRVEELADRRPGERPEGAVPYSKYIPLSELIAAVKGKGVATKNTWQEYYRLVGKLGNEYDIIRKVPEDELVKNTSKDIAEAILLNRRQEIEVIPGYDGVYGVPKIGQPKLSASETKVKNRQLGLSEFT